MKLKTIDNNVSAPLQIDEETYTHFKKISNTTLKTLINRNPDLLVFPADIEDSKDGLGDKPIFTTSKIDGKYTLNTSNLMGFIGVNDIQLKITSRFNNGGDNDNFLHYLLNKVLYNSPNIFNLPSAAEKTSDSLRLYMFVFPSLLKKAMQAGLFKSYETIKYNNSALKGSLDASRHIRNNIPFMGKIAYSTREFSYDNPLMQLVRHTIEYIKEKGFYFIFSADRDIKSIVMQIYEATTSYSRSDREKIFNLNLKPLKHPFYEYSALQRLCMLILHDEDVKFTETETNKIYGILFDGAWLWEEYLATILVNNQYNHPENKKRIDGLRMFNNEADRQFNEDGIFIDKSFRKIYPDFYKNNAAVIDAKYKKLETGLRREDIYQMIAYMHTLHYDLGGFIYPQNRIKQNTAEENQTEYYVKHHSVYHLNGYGGRIFKYGFFIPSDASQNFKEEMQNSESEMLSYLENLYRSAV